MVGDTWCTLLFSMFDSYPHRICLPSSRVKVSTFVSFSLTLDVSVRSFVLVGTKDSEMKIQR